MCPMHRNQKTQQEKMPCHGTDQSQPTCMCAPNPQTQAVIPPFAPRATVNVHNLLFLPAITEEVYLFDLKPELIRFVSPPEQPPRL